MTHRPAFLSALRSSILAALGVALAPGCNGKGGETTAGEGSDGSTGSGSTASTSGGTSEGSSSGGSGSGSAGSSGGTSGSGSSSGAGESSGTTGAVPPACEGSTPIDQGFVDPPAPSGFELCPDGTIHRVTPTECLAPKTPSSCTDNSGGGCLSDADCTEFPHGSCQQDMAFGGVVGVGGTCSCVYGCATDAECDAGEICRCAGEGLGLYTECVQGGCVDDSECGDYLCALSPDTCAPGGFLTMCHGPGDACLGDDACPDLVHCVYQDYAMPPQWACNDAVCGRPFTVDGAARVAPLVADEAWSKGQGPGPEVAGLDAGERRLLGEHWALVGAMEHASVASFARFVLELLALGAPPELVMGAQQALADEVDHARRAYALASAYAGEALGPGPLAIDGALAAAGDRAALARAVVREACLGETLAAIEAAAAAEAAGDPAVRRALAVIAGDEARHAGLGWQALAWLLEGLDAATRGAIEEEVALAIAALERGGAALAPASARARRLADHGLLAADAREAALQRGIREVLRPAGAALAGRRRAA